MIIIIIIIIIINVIIETIYRGVHPLINSQS